MSDNNKLELILSGALKLPIVHINRETFLEKELIKYCPKEQVQNAISNNPAYAGIDISIINKIADNCINYETNKVSSLSFFTGLPGGIAVLGTIPADLTQYFAHILRIMQKLAYLYGWQEIINSREILDDETNNLLTLFIGVMFGINSATNAITKITTSTTQATTKAIMKTTFVKNTMYPIIKKTSKILGIKMTKNIFSKSIAKAIPVIGGITSGGLTYLSYKSMSIKFKNYLSTLKWCDVYYYSNTYNFASCSQEEASLLNFIDIDINSI